MQRCLATPSCNVAWPERIHRTPFSKKTLVAPTESRNNPLDRLPTSAFLVATGLILGLAYPPNPVGLFGAVGLAPLLYALHRATSWKQAFRWSYLSFLLFSALTTWWVGSWQSKTEPYLMISCVLLIIIHPLFFVTPMLLYRWVMKRSSVLQALLFLPFLWTGGEYLHALSDASYPWLTLGNTQTYNHYFIQFIEFTGVWGLSFVLVVLNCAVAALLFAAGEKFPEQQKKQIWRGAWIAIAAGVLLPYLHGLLRDESPTKGGGMSITIIQPNVDPWDKWKQADTVNQIALNAAMTRNAIAPLQQKPDMALWVETAIPRTLTTPGAEGRMAEVMEVVNSLDVSLMSGFPDYRRYPTPAEAPASAKLGIEYGAAGQLDSFRYDHFNAVGLFVPGKGLTGAYHKMQLVPFGERIPFADELPFLIKMLTWDMGISAWGKGKSITVFDVPLRHGGVAKGGAVVCFESVYPNVVRKFVDSGANFLTVVTNDGWYLGTTGPLQHQRFALLRAIENRRPIARAANTGISCFISPNGELYNESDQNVATAITDQIELRSDLTLYTRWGDWWPQLCLAIAAALGMAVGVRKKKG